MLKAPISNFYNRLREKGIFYVLSYYLNVSYIRMMQLRVFELIRAYFINKIDHLYFSERNFPYKERKALLFHNVTWGEAYFDMLFQYAIPSILQSENLPQLYNDGYKGLFYLYTKKSDIELLEKKYAKVIIELSKYLNFKVMALEDIIDGVNYADKGPLLHQTFLSSMRFCLDHEYSLINFCSDAVFANSSLFNIAKVAEGKNVTISAAHPRVSFESIMEHSDIKERFENLETISSEELVDIAFKYPHNTIENSFDDNELNMTNEGLSIRKIGNIYSVIHNLPSPYLLNFMEEDYKYFQNRIYNHIDKTWPRQLLKRNRLKLVASSDLFFMVELTLDTEERNMKEHKFNDYYRKKEDRNLWHFFANSFTTTWRGGK